MTRVQSGRLIALLLALLSGFVAVVAKLGTIQVTDRQELQNMAYQQRVHTIDLPATRGQILDRSGRTLAITLPARDIYADPSEIGTASGEAKRLAPVLGLKPKQVEGALTAPGSFSYVARQVSPSTAAKVESMHLPGIGSLPSTRRDYPDGAIAPQVLGFVGTDGTGLDGLELQYQTLLAGTPGKATQELSPTGQPIAQGVDQVKPPIDGTSIETTIDPPIQYQAQVALQQAVKDNHAKGGTIVVMDPHTGDVYAMATYPWFDPNSFQTATPATFSNLAVTNSFEPGSVNKVITAAAAIQTSALPLNKVLQVPYSERVGTYTIHDSHWHPVEGMTLGDIVAESSNVGATKVASMVGAGTLDSYLGRFGFGAPTGVGFPGEIGGDVPPLSSWSDVSLATIAFGQGLSVTPLQMASVYATVANGGVQVRPRLVRGTVDPSGAFHATPPSASHRVISSSTSDMLSRMLAYVVKDGTGVNAQVTGYQVAGKTGTAQIPYTNRPGYSNKYIASFIGFLPASAPQVVIGVFIDQPATQYGGIAAAPCFQQVAKYAIQRLAISPSTRLPLPPHVLRIG